MHATITHQIALENQRRLLDQAAADRLARLATAGRPTLVARLLSALRGRPRPSIRHAQPRTADSGRA